MSYYVAVPAPVHVTDEDGEPMMRPKKGVNLAGRELMAQLSADEKEPVVVNMRDFLRMVVCEDERYNNSFTAIQEKFDLLEQFDVAACEGGGYVVVSEVVHRKVVSVLEKPQGITRYGNAPVIQRCMAFGRAWLDAKTDPPKAEAPKTA